MKDVAEYLDKAVTLAKHHKKAAICVVAGVVVIAVVLVLK